VILGVIAGGVTLAVYMVGAGRSLDYDSSVSVGEFIATPSVLDSLSRQVVYNNHPVLSLLDHMVYSLGGTTEAALRVVPASFAAATVGVVAAFCARRWTTAAGVAAALILASNPMFAELSREVRGYSILAFSAVSSTVLLSELLAQKRGWRGPAYIATLGIGLGTHLFAAFVLVGHVALVLIRGEFAREWAWRWLMASLVASLFYLLMLRTMAANVINGQGRVFHPSFPIDLATELLGTNPITVVSVGILMVGALWVVRRSELLVLLGCLAAVVAFIWLVLAPAFLFPRFFVWAVPAVAVAAAAVIARRPAALLLASIAAIAAIADLWPRWNEDPLPTKTAAAYVMRARDDGGHACSVGYIGESLAAYTEPPAAVHRARELDDCDLVVAIPAFGGRDRRLSTLARRRFRHRWKLPGRTDIAIFSRIPKSALQPLPPARISAVPITPDHA